MTPEHKLAAEIAANRKKAYTAHHAAIQRQSHRAFLLGAASDPILAMASAPYEPVAPRTGGLQFKVRK